MKTQLHVVADVKGLGKVVEVASDFYTELNQLRDGGATLISPRKEAYARLQTRGKKDIGKSYGTRTSAGFEYARGQLPIFRIKSRLTNPGLAKLAVEANRAGNYFHTESTKEYEESLKQAETDKSKEPEKRSVIVLPSRQNFTMSDKENWDVYKAVLKDQAKSYFGLNGPITVYPVAKDTVDAQSGTILTELWFRDLDGRSDFGGHRGLHDDDGARGVLRKSAEGTVQKVLPYTPRQISKYAAKVMKVREALRKGKIDVSRLERELTEVSEFLGLKQ